MENENTTYHIEYTDTFCGQANYSWVKRFEITLPTNVSDDLLKRIAKELVGLQGIRGTWDNLGDLLKFIPSNSCTILFISWE